MGIIFSHSLLRTSRLNSELISFFFFSVSECTCLSLLDWESAQNLQVVLFARRSFAALRRRPIRTRGIQK